MNAPHLSISDQELAQIASGRFDLEHTPICILADECLRHRQGRTASQEMIRRVVEGALHSNTRASSSRMSDAQIRDVADQVARALVSTTTSPSPADPTPAASVGSSRPQTQRTPPGGKDQ